AMLCSVLAKDTSTRPARDVLRFRRVQLQQVLQRVTGVVGDENFLSGHEELRETAPLVRDDRHAARGCFEQTYTRREAVRGHVRACEIQCEALAAVEGSVCPRRYVLDPLHVARPFDRVG